MIKSEYAIAYKEVFEILKYISKEDYNKIPSEKIELYKVMQEKNYNFKYNPSKTLDEQNVSKRAKAIIALLFRENLYIFPFSSATDIFIGNPLRCLLITALQFV